MPADARLVRLATEDDADALTAIYLDSARHHVAIDPRWHVVPERADALARIETKLADAAAELYVAQVAGAVAGLLELRVMEPPPRGAMVRAVPTAEVGIAVAEAHRGRGTGTALMAHAERWAAERGCRRIALETSSANAEALRFYERLGYRPYGLPMRKDVAPEGNNGG